MNKVSALLHEKMNWHSFKEPMIDIYSHNFTEAEIQGLITFYRSDIGRSMTKKMPLIIQNSIVLSQQLMQDFIPEVQSLAKELSVSIEQSRQKKQKNKKTKKQKIQRYCQHLHCQYLIYKSRLIQTVLKLKILTKHFI
jgi:hypothetical protein